VACLPRRAAAAGLARDGIVVSGENIAAHMKARQMDGTKVG
jgi:hypothetical protein